jgi:hypothetical protein
MRELNNAGTVFMVIGVRDYKGRLQQRGMRKLKSAEKGVLDYRW